MSERWTDRIVGDRMTVDQSFNDRVQQSRFSNQEWSIIMTAVEFDIEHPDDDERATLVAETDNIPAIMPELDQMRQRQHPAAPGGRNQESGDSLLGGIKNALGLGSGDDSDSDGTNDSSNDVDPERLEAAETLAQSYAEELQAHLEDRGKWAEIRAAAAAEHQ